MKYYTLAVVHVDSVLQASQKPLTRPTEAVGELYVPSVVLLIKVLMRCIFAALSFSLSQPYSSSDRPPPEHFSKCLSASSVTLENLILLKHPLLIIVSLVFFLVSIHFLPSFFNHIKTVAAQTSTNVTHSVMYLCVKKNKNECELGVIRQCWFFGR